MASVPFVRDLLQPGKAALCDDAGLDRLCHKLAEEMAPDHLYVLGTGTTVARILDHLDLEGTLAGEEKVRPPEPARPPGRHRHGISPSGHPRLPKGPHLPRPQHSHESGHLRPDHDPLIHITPPL